MLLLTKYNFASEYFLLLNFCCAMLLFLFNFSQVFYMILNYILWCTLEEEKIAEGGTKWNQNFPLNLIEKKAIPLLKNCNKSFISNLLRKKNLNTENLFCMEWFRENLSKNIEVFSCLFETILILLKRFFY